MEVGRSVGRVITCHWKLIYTHGDEKSGKSGEEEGGTALLVLFLWHLFSRLYPIEAREVDTSISEAFVISKQPTGRKGFSQYSVRWRLKLKWSSLNSRGFACSAGVARGKRLAIRMLLFSLAKNWYSINLCLFVFSVFSLDEWMFFWLSLMGFAWNQLKLLAFEMRFYCVLGLSLFWFMQVNCSEPCMLIMSLALFLEQLSFSLCRLSPLSKCLYQGEPS